MNTQNRSIRGKGIVTLLTAVTIVLGMGASRAWADEPIVGFWQATWKDATDGHVVEYVWDTWHNDRTETQNDSGNTISGNVCQGAWTPLGERTYGLTHPAFAFVCPSCFGAVEPEDQE